MLAFAQTRHPAAGGRLAVGLVACRPSRPNYLRAHAARALRASQKRSLNSAGIAGARQTDSMVSICWEQDMLRRDGAASVENNTPRDDVRPRLTRYVAGLAARGRGQNCPRRQFPLCLQHAGKWAAASCSSRGAGRTRAIEGLWGLRSFVARPSRDPLAPHRRQLGLPVAYVQAEQLANPHQDQRAWLRRQIRSRPARCAAGARRSSDGARVKPRQCAIFISSSPSPILFYQTFARPRRNAVTFPGGQARPG